MAVENYTLVTYDGLDIGGIYLGDIGKRAQLGGGVQGELAQDTYISKGESICLVTTGDVLMSQLSGTTGSPGVLRRYSTDNEAELLSVLVASGALPAGTTGFDAPITLLASATCTGVVRFGTTGVKVNPSKTEGDF
jgi:hypothetical protein